MTREEEIKQAEIKYSDDTLFDGCDYIGQYAKQEAFIAGAKWADEHPKPGIVNNQEFIDKTINYFTPILKTYCSEECVKELIDGFVNLINE